MRILEHERCRAIKDGGARCERKVFSDGGKLCERHIISPPHFVAATTDELARALGASDHVAQQLQTRIEYLAGNKPKAIK